MKEVVFKGVAHVATGEGTSSECMFGAEEFKEVLRRCERLGVEIFLLGRESKKKAERRNDGFGKTRFPNEVLRSWMKEGFKDGFWAFYAVPDDALEKWEEGRSPRGGTADK